MTSRLFLLLALAMLTGCASQVPVAENYPLTVQRKARAAHHWDVMADDVVNQVLAAQTGRPDLAGRRLFVGEPPHLTPFARAFRNFLITRMVNRGLEVATDPRGAVELTFETQVVKHQSERFAHRPGTLTLLAAGLMVAHDISLGAFTDSKVLGTLALTQAGEIGLGHLSGGPTKTELLLTTSIASEGRFAMRRSDVYYFEEEDVVHYLPVAPAVVAPSPVRTWKVTDR